MRKEWIDFEIRTHATESPHGLALHTLTTQDQDSSGRLAVLFPGQAYSCDRPLLHFARLAALAEGCDVLALEFGFQAARRPGPGGEIEVLLDEARQAVEWALRTRQGPSSLFLIAKSLGTAVVAEMLGTWGFPQARSLFLTPVERAAPMVGPGGATAVIGTLDPFYGRPGIQASIAAHPDGWRILAGLDHSLESPMDVRASLEALGTVTEIVRSFVTAG